MLKTKNRDNKLFYQFNIDEFVPSDHFLKKVSQIISFDFIRDKVKHLYSPNGKPAIDPVVLIKMMLIGYFYNIPSERQLEKDLQVNLAYRWFIGYDLDEKIPDHSTISQTRRRKFTESNLFQEIFDEIVQNLVDKGFIDGETIFTDSTHIKANAAIKSLRPTEEYLKLLENNKDKEEKISNENHYSKTDPDSKIMGRPGKPGGLHYLEHRSVDVTGFITDVFITSGNASDHLNYIDRLKRQQSTFGYDIRKCVADKGYGYHHVYQELTDMGIQGFIPYRGNHFEAKYEFTSKDFEYHKETDVYICPEGNVLHRRKKINTKDNAFVYSCKKNTCFKCRSRKKCVNTKYDMPKLIERSIYQNAVDQQLEGPSKAEWKWHMKMRKILIEGSFADGKCRHGLGRARMRGLKKIAEQSFLCAVAQNIRKMLFMINKKEQVALRLPAPLSFLLNFVFRRTVPIHLGLC